MVETHFDELHCEYCGGWFKARLILFLFKRKRMVTCPYCNRVSQYRFTPHITHEVVGSNEREQHERLEEVWKNG